MADMMNAPLWYPDQVKEYPKQSKPRELTAAERKTYPVYTGLLKYFPDALMEVAHVSKVGNDQHNPGQPLHWARGKSMDQLDALSRHLTDHASGKRRDPDGERILAKVVWRGLAELQLEIERDRDYINPNAGDGQPNKGD